MNHVKENWIALYTLLRREIMRFLRIWGQTILPPMITMILYFIIFGNLMGRRIGAVNGIEYIQFIAPGLIMMSIITNSYGNVVASFFSAKFMHNIEEMLVSPMPDTFIIWGFILGGVARGMLVGILVTILALLFTHLPMPHPTITLLVALLTSVLFSLAGLLNGLFAKKMDDINIIPTFILTPLTYFAGVFYSIQLLPSFWQQASYVNPIVYMVNAFRYGMLGEAEIHVGAALLIMFSLTVILYVWVHLLFKKGFGIRT